MLVQVKCHLVKKKKQPSLSDFSPTSRCNVLVAKKPRWSEHLDERRNGFGAFSFSCQPKSQSINLEIPILGKRYLLRSNSVLPTQTGQRALWWTRCSIAKTIQMLTVLSVLLPPLQLVDQPSVSIKSTSQSWRSRQTWNIYVSLLLWSVVSEQNRCDSPPLRSPPVSPPSPQGSTAGVSYTIHHSS